MHLALRIVLVWLLAAALPLQGWAAARMLHCAPSHHRMAAAEMPATAHAHGGHEQHGQHLADAAAQAPADDLGTLGKYKCSACAACSVGLALPSTVPAFDAPAAVHVGAAGLPAITAVFLTGGLERPPRFLA